MIFNSKCLPKSRSNIKMKISVICCWNNLDILNRDLVPSINRQNHSGAIEKIYFDNTECCYNNAADALNHCADIATGDIFIFIHQDVELLGDNFFEKLLIHIDQLSNMGAAGIVGAIGPDRRKRIRGRCIQGLNIDNTFMPIESIEKVQTLDELLLITSKVVFQKIKFDPITCNSWDLYGVDYCLRCSEHGYVNYVLPLAVRHASWGRLGPSYYKTLKNLIKRHSSIKIIYTTCGVWFTKFSIHVNFIIHKSNSFYEKVLLRMGIK